ncbi:MAG: hypothetical protein ACK4SP_13585 [Sphingomonas parapaucimobilis]
MLEQKPWEMNWDGVQAEAAPTRKAALNGPLDLNAPARPPKSAAEQAAYAKIAAIRSMRRASNRAHELYDRDMSATGVAGLKEYNPFRTENQRFDGAVAAVPLLARQAFRVPGSGSDSNAELKLITDALPNRWATDASNRQRFENLGSVFSDMIGNYGYQAGYSPEQIAALRAEDGYRPTARKGLPKPPPSSRRATSGRVVVDITGKRVN